MIMWEDHATGSVGYRDGVTYVITEIERGYTLQREDKHGQKVGPKMTYRGRDLDEVKAVASGRGTHERYKAEGSQINRAAVG